MIVIPMSRAKLSATLSLREFGKNNVHFARMSTPQTMVIEAGEDSRATGRAIDLLQYIWTSIHLHMKWPPYPGARAGQYRKGLLIYSNCDNGYAIKPVWRPK